MTGETLHNYLRDCTAFLSPIGVAGHPAPDTDAAVSSLFEAWRMTLGGTPAVPVLQGHLSRETAYLLGVSPSPASPPRVENGCSPTITTWIVTTAR